MKAAVVVVALAIAGCGPGAGDDGPTPTVSGVSQSVADDAVLGLCQAIAALSEDPGGAGAVFQDRAHQALHVLAGALEQVDRALAGEVLVAKQAVEADLGLGPPSPEHLETLLDATRAGVERLGLRAQACPS